MKEENIRFIDIKKRKEIDTEETRERVLDYIDDCSKDSLKPKKEE